MGLVNLHRHFSPISEALVCFYHHFLWAFSMSICYEVSLHQEVALTTAYVLVGHSYRVLATWLTKVCALGSVVNQIFLEKKREHICMFC